MSLALAYPLAQALPQGGQVVQGQVALSPGLIQQGSDKAIVNWQAFSIGAGETLRVQQPGVNSVLLNRVVGGDPSLLLGQLQANGRVFLVNPRGIVFGRGSQVDVGGLVASTLDLSDTDFLAGVYRFSAGAGAGALEADGRIDAPGGTVALLAPTLSVGGQVSARRVALAAASTVQVDVEGDGLVLFNLRNDDGRDASLRLNGQVLAEGSAELRAQARAGAAGQVLNMDGLVQARGLRQQGGRIVIDGGTAGDTFVRGRLDASGETGGQVTVLGQRVGLLDAALVDASGRAGGGEVQIGGGLHGEGTAHNAERTYVGADVEIRADATAQGQGGRVAVWADQRTDMLGRISARGGQLSGDGGFVETSGRQTLHMPRGAVDVGAARGRAGQWLLDPYNLTIQDTGGTGGDMPGPSPFEPANDNGVLDVGVLNTALGSGGTVTVQTGSGGSQVGNITVAGDIHANGATGLSLLAAGSINFTGAGGIRATGTALDVQLKAGAGVDTHTGSIDTLGGKLSVVAAGAVSLGAVSLVGATRGELSVATTGPVTLSSLQGGKLTVQSSGGDVVLPTGLASDTVSITTSGGSLTQAAGTLTAAAAVVVDTGAGNVTLGDLRPAAGLDITTTSGGVMLGGTAVTGQLRFNSSTGSLKQTSAISVTGGADLRTGGSITLDGNGNSLQGTLDVSAATADLHNAGGTALTLGQVTVGGALALTTVTGDATLGTVTVGGGLRFTSTSGLLTQSGPLDLTGGAVLSTTGRVTLAHGGNSLRGTLDITAGPTELNQGGSLPLTLGALHTGTLKASTGSGVLTLGQGSVGDLDVATTGGDIAQAGSGLSVTGDAVFSTASAGRVTLGQLGTSAKLQVTTVSGDVSLGRTTVGGPLRVISTSGSLVQTGKLDIGGSATLQVGGDITLADTGNLWGAGVQVTANSLDLAAGGSLSLLGLSLGANQRLSLQALGNLSLGPAFTLNTGSADLILSSGGTFSVLGSLSGGHVALTASTGLSLGQDINATGNLQLTTGSGGVSQSGGRLNVTGATTVSAGTSDIDLSRPTNHFGGAVSLVGGTSSLSGDGPLALGLSSTGALNVTALGAITQTAKLTVAGTATFHAGAAPVTLDNPLNDLQGDVTVTGTAVSLAAAHDLHLVSLTQLQLNQALELDAQGRLFLPAGIHSINTGTAPLKLSSRGDDLATFGPLQGGNVTLIGKSVVLGHDVTASGTLDVQSTAGEIRQDLGHLSAAGASFKAVGGGITVMQSGNDLRGAVDLAGGATQLKTEGNLRLGQVDITGTLQVQSVTGTISQTTDGVAVSGTARFTAAGTLTLDEAANRWGGAVSLTGGAARLQGQGAVTLGSLSVSSLWLRAGGPVGQALPLTLAGALTVDAGTSPIDLSDGGNQLSGAVSLTGGATQLHTQGALTLAQASITGDMNLSSRGLLRQSGGTLGVTGKAAFDAGSAAITLDDTGNSWGDAVSLSGGAAKLSGGAVKLGAVNVASLELKTGGPVTQATGLHVAGALTVDAGTASIDLSGTGNQLGGLVTLTGGVTKLQAQAALTLGALATGKLDVQSHGPLNLGQGNVTGDLGADSGNGAITQAGGLRVTGAAVFASGSGDINLPNHGNQFLGALSLTGNAVTVFNQPSLAFGTLSFNSLDATSNGGITLGSGTLTGGLTARALGGSITQAAGGLVVQGDTTLQASAGISFNEGGNRLFGTVTLSGGTTALSNGTALRLGSVSSTDLTLHATGAITQTGALNVGGAASLDAGSASITLGQGGNRFSGLLSLRGGTVVVGTNSALRLGQLQVNSLTAQSSGGLQLGTGSVAGELVARSGGAPITQAAGGLAVGGAATLDAGGGAVQFGDAGNAFSGLVNLTAGDVTLANGVALRLGLFTVQDLTLNAGRDIDLGSGTVNGDLSATTRGQRITQTGALVVKGRAGFVADGGLVDLVLDNAGNQLLGAIEMRGLNGGSFVSANFASALDLSFTGDVQTLTLSSGGRLTLGGGHNQTLTAAARNGIVQTGALQVSGETTLIARGGTDMAVDFSQAGNDLRGVTLKADAGGSLGRVQLREDDAARRDGVRVTGDAAGLDVTSAGALEFGGGRYTRLQADTSAAGAAITQGGALVVDSLAGFKAGTGDITLTRADNRLPSFTVGSAGVASVTSLGDYTVGPSAVSTRLALAGPGAITLSGPLDGSGALQMSGSGSLTLSSAHGYRGGTRIDSGRLVLQGAAAVPGSGAVQLGAAGQLELRDSASLAGELVVRGGRISGHGTLAGPVTLQAAAVFEPGADGLRVSGALRDGGAGFGLRLVGAGTLTLTASNAYAGSTDIASGTLRAAAPGALPEASAVQLAPGATLALGVDQAIGSLAGAGRADLGGFTLATGADGRDTVFTGGLVGTGGLTKRGAGRFTLGGTGEQAGATRIEAGELVLASAAALSDATAVSVDAGARLTVQQPVRLGSLAGAGVVDLQAARLIVGVDGSSTRWAGAITGSGALDKGGAGTFTLAGSNGFTGGLQVLAGTLQLEAGGVRAQAATPASGPVLPATAAVSVASGATLALLGDVAIDTLVGPGQLQLGSSTLTLGAAGGSSRFDGGLAGSGGLVKAGAGTFTLAGSSRMTGPLRVAEGALVLDAEQALGGSGALVIEAAGRVQANAAQTVASLSGAGRLVLNGASLAAGVDGSDSRFDGVVSGTGTLVKQGAGTLTLTGGSTYDGGTRIEAGALRLSGQGSLGPGAVLNDGQLVLDRSDALTLDQAVSGRGSLVVRQGQVTLASAANRYSGATQVLGGTLLTTAADRLPDASAVQVAAGAELQLGGAETVASLQAAGSVRLAGNFTTQGEQVYSGSLTVAAPAGVTLMGSLIDASHSSNQFGSGPLGLQGGQARVTAKGTLVLGDVALSQGGQIEAERLALDGRLQLGGGALTLVATAAPDDAKATLYGTAQVPVSGQLLALAEATVQQGAASTITVAEGASLQVNASGGGSVLLERDGNSFKGALAVLSGAAYNTAWQPNAKGTQAIQSQVRVAGQQLLVGGSGIEADLVYLRADQLATAGSAALVARLPYDEIVLGRALSAPGLTLALAPGAFGVPGSFGAINGQAIQVAVGSTETGARTVGPNAGWLTVLPKAGAQGATAVVLVGPKVGSVPASGGPAYRFFHDGAARPSEIPVVYNGVLPLTPAASGALSSINGDAEEARRARFQETVRTENVTVRLRAGVIAEVGPGRASTQGSEGAQPPVLCDPADRPVLSCKPPATP